MLSFVCGQLCCGKTTYAKALVNLTEGVFIEVGDIVRSIKQTENRQLLQDSKDLWKEIVNKLDSVVEKEDKAIIVCGVRQKEILEYFPNSTLIWINCPVIERKKRYEQRSRQGDSISFELAEEGDVSLGIMKVKEYILTNK